MSNPYDYEKGYEQPVVWSVAHWSLDDGEWMMFRAPVIAYSEEEAFKAAEKAGLVLDHPLESDYGGQPLRIIGSTPDPVVFGQKVLKKGRKGKL